MMEEVGGGRRGDGELWARGRRGSPHGRDSEGARKEEVRVLSVLSVLSLSLSLSIYLPFSLSIRRARLTRAAPSLGTLGNENAKGRVGGVQRVSWLGGQD